MPIIVKDLAQIKIPKGSKELIKVLDRNLIFVQSSQTILKISGCENKKYGLRGLTYHDWDPRFEEDVPEWEQTCHHVISTKKDSTILVSTEFSIGIIQRMLVRLEPIFDFNQNVIGLAIKSQIITEHENLMAVSKRLEMVSGELLQNTPQLLLPTYPNFSKAQSTVLFHFIMGKTFAEIALLLNISKTSVSNMLAKIKKKLNCNNKQDLYTKLQALGCLKIIPIG